MAETSHRLMIFVQGPARGKFAAQLFIELRELLHGFWEKKNGTIHPRKLTWNPRTDGLWMFFLFQGAVFRFHVSFLGCKPHKSYKTSQNQRRLKGHLALKKIHLLIFQFVETDGRLFRQVLNDVDILSCASGK